MYSQNVITFIYLKITEGECSRKNLWPRSTPKQKQVHKHTHKASNVWLFQYVSWDSTIIWKARFLRAHAARHTPSCLWHFPKHLKSFDGCQQSHGPDIFVPNGLSHNPTFLWLPLCAIARLSALTPTNRGARNAHFLVLDTGHRPTSSRNKPFSFSIRLCLTLFQLGSVTRYAVAVIRLIPA